MSSHHFAFCFDENYASYAAVCIRSIILNNCNKSNIIHILSDSLSHNAIAILKEAASSPNSRLEIHIIDDKILGNLPRGTWPIQAWYRILLPDAIPPEVDKILYLDCDTLVMSNLADLFKLDISNNSLAALPDPQSFSSTVFQRCGYNKNKKYFCSGIMLINLDYWRKNNLKHKLAEIALELKDRVKFPDQDCLNILCQDSKLLLPYKYGVMQWYFIDEIRKQISRNELFDCLLDPKIVHFAGCAPWNKSLRPSLYSAEWDKINSTLRHKSPVKYNCKKSVLIKKIIHNILHPYNWQKKRKNRMTYKYIINLLKKD